MKMKTTRLHRFLCAAVLGAAATLAVTATAHAQDVKARTARFGHGLDGVDGEPLLTTDSFSERDAKRLAELQKQYQVEAK